MNNLGISSPASKLASVIVASLVACGACAEEDPAGPSTEPTTSNTSTSTAPTTPMTAPTTPMTAPTTPMTAPMPTPTMTTPMPMPTPTMTMTAPPATTTAPTMTAPTIPVGPIPDPNEIEPIPPATGQAPSAYSTCGACHGPGGEGIDNLGPDLRHVPAGYREHVVRNGRDGNPDLLIPMSPYNEEAVSDAELAEIFGWLDSQPMPMTGQGLYADLCANCHGADADGVPEKDLTLLVANVPAAVRNGFNPDQMANVAEYMPSWTAEQLSDEQISLIMGYLTALGQ